MELFQFIIATILSGLLALSGATIGYIDAGIAFFTREKEKIEEIVNGYQNEEFSRLPSVYEFTGPPRVLLENRSYQQAAVGGAIPTITRDTTTPLPQQVENAIVNVFCTLETDKIRRVSTGSGVFIDPRGVILTNAHVAQFLLLESDNSERTTKCIIRSGNPATPQYEAKLLYISPAWIQQNAELIDSPAPSGTGERDYALLYVSDALSGEIPELFSFVPTDTKLVTRRLEDTSVYAGGYPAEVLIREGADGTLVPKVDNTEVVDFFTFGSGYADLITIADSDIGEQGSSGGAVVKEDGFIVGLIVTKGDPSRNGPRSLRALTLSYIDRTIEEETGFGLASTLSGDLAFRGEVFKEALVPFLRTMLVNEFN